MSRWDQKLDAMWRRLEGQDGLEREFRDLVEVAGREVSRIGLKGGAFWEGMTEIAIDAMERRLAEREDHSLDDREYLDILEAQDLYEGLS